MLIMTDESGRLIGAGLDASRLAKSLSSYRPPPPPTAAPKPAVLVRQSAKAPPKTDGRPVLLLMKSHGATGTPKAPTTGGGFSRLCAELDEFRRWKRTHGKP
jgi:hypothetical protein